MNNLSNILENFLNRYDHKFKHKYELFTENLFMVHYLKGEIKPHKFGKIFSIESKPGIWTRLGTYDYQQLQEKENHFKKHDITYLVQPDDIVIYGRCLKTRNLTPPLISIATNPRVSIRSHHNGSKFQLRDKLYKHLETTLSLSNSR